MRLYAAGSLRAAMTDLAQSYRAAGGPEVTATFGASGLLRERIEKGEATDVFASADVGNAQRLADAHRSGAPVVFARNQLCVLVGPGVAATRRRCSSGCSTRRQARHVDAAAGPGRYTWQTVREGGQGAPGAFEALDRKALKLTGETDSPPPSDGSIYAADRRAEGRTCHVWHQRGRGARGRARACCRSPELAVGASYALVVERRAAGRGQFALYVMSIPGQAVLARHGFAPVAAP